MIGTSGTPAYPLSPPWRPRPSAAGAPPVIAFVGLAFAQTASFRQYMLSGTHTQQGVDHGQVGVEVEEHVPFAALLAWISCPLVNPSALGHDWIRHGVD